jgi:ATP-dependent RNA helicase DeaD
MNALNFQSFAISEEILNSIEKLGYENPSDVQKIVIPLALEDKDIIVKSKTGSGKTAAFAIPLCEKIEIEVRDPQVLVLTPTRELAVQVKEDFHNIGRFKRVRCTAVFGKQPMEVQKRELRQRVHVIVGTPGRTLDHIERGNIHLEGIKYLIIDEADEMLNMGFIDQVESVINSLPKNRVTMLFSATMPQAIENLCNRFMNKPTRIEIEPKETSEIQIQQFYYEIDENKKFNLLNKVIYTQIPDSCIIFCNTKDAVDTLSNKMKDKGYSCNRLHGGMEQKDRLEIMQSFKKGEFNFLIATDVAARGIDVENITHVINYDVPVEKESYVHRIGRTGRAGNRGTAITFVCAYEHRLLKDIENFTGITILKKLIPSEEEVEQGKKLYKEKTKTSPKPKNIKGDNLNSEITKVYINAGKNKKMRPGDIVGAITNIEGVSSEDIGIIDVQDNLSYVDILNGKGKIVLNELQRSTIKGKSVRVQKADK